MAAVREFYGLSAREAEVAELIALVESFEPEGR